MSEYCKNCKEMRDKLENIAKYLKHDIHAEFERESVVHIINELLGSFRNAGGADVLSRDNR